MQPVQLKIRAHYDRRQITGFDHFKVISNWYSGAAPLGSFSLIIIASCF